MKDDYLAGLFFAFIAVPGVLREKIFSIFTLKKSSNKTGQKSGVSNINIPDIFSRLKKGFR